MAPPHYHEFSLDCGSVVVCEFHDLLGRTSFHSSMYITCTLHLLNRIFYTFFVKQGQVWKCGMNKYFRKIFALVDENKMLRKFAARYIYSKEVYTDFFAVSFLLALQAIVSISILFYWQVSSFSRCCSYR